MQVSAWNSPQNINFSQISSSQNNTCDQSDLTKSPQKNSDTHDLGYKSKGLWISRVRRQMPLSSQCIRLTGVQFGSSPNITGSHCPPELLQQPLSTKQMTLSQLKRSQRSRVKSQSTQSIPRRRTPFQGPLAGIYGWALHLFSCE